ncbi:hypothetical protein UlMin_010990, partial [Ulmus minor]
MRSANAVAPSPLLPRFSTRTSHHFTLHCSMPRPPNRSRRKPRRTTFINPTNPSFSSPSPLSDSSDAKLQTVIDLDFLYNSYQSQFHYFLAAGKDAYTDLQSLVTLDSDHRVVVSCRRSTLRFLGNFAVCSFVVVLGFRVLVGLLKWVFKARFRSRGYKTVVRRDRSLGGKEVVVGTIDKGRGESMGWKSFGGLNNPLSVANESFNGGSERVSKNLVRVGQRLPKWWPNLEPQLDSVVDKEYQREADRLIRAITDNRMTGKDIVEDDIIHLRRICRISGVRVSFDTTNTRDSIYRASVDFILTVCGRAPSYSSYIQVDGEDVRQFIAGLAVNIGLENTSAARIVSAAVAARTRSSFLQAWALEIQGKHAEAKLELSKICLVLRIFPPEESSPEMEMVARSLEKHLKLEQREFLMNLLTGVCGKESKTTLAEALGL